MVSAPSQLPEPAGAVAHSATSISAPGAKSVPVTDVPAKAATGAAGTFSTPWRGGAGGPNEIGALTALPTIWLKSATVTTHVPGFGVQSTFPFAVTRLARTVKSNP